MYINPYINNKCCTPKTASSGCSLRLPGECVYYSGSTIAGVGVNPGDDLNVALNKIATNLASGGVTSVGLTMPSAFTVSNSPITGAGTLMVTGTGNINQYINGTGALTNFPSIPSYAFSTGLSNITNTITANISTGLTGGQSIYGGTNAAESLTLSSTINATKGKIFFGTSAYDELNNRLGINTNSPAHDLHIAKLSGGSVSTLIESSVANNFRLRSILNGVSIYLEGVPVTVYVPNRSFSFNQPSLMPAGLGSYVWTQFDHQHHDQTTGTTIGFQVSQKFHPTSGNAVFNAVDITGEINQTGGANGISRGIYMNTILTSAADYRAIEIINNSNWAIYQSGANARSLFAGLLRFTGLPTYANDGAAGAGGLITGDIYKTATGELRIKL